MSTSDHRAATPPLRSCALTDPGMRRDINEDCYCERPDLGLFIVADGLGGHPGGLLASRVVVDAMEATVGGTLEPADYARYRITPAAERVRSLRDAFHVAYERLAAVAGEAADLHGMATTVAAVLFDEVRDRPAAGCPATVAHIGDSRVYLWRDDRFRRLTDDHSWVEEQVRAGLLESEAARVHPWRSLITRALSASEEEVEPDMKRVPLAAGDRLLICSDGLTSVVTDEQIATVLGYRMTAHVEETICQSLIHMANLAGGPDNITVIVVSL